MSSRTDFWLTKRYRDSIINTVEDNDLRVICIGTICYDSAPNLTVLDIAHSAAAGSLDFNKLHGFYKIVIFVKETKEYIFWGDNQGSQVFFIDSVAKTFSDSFISLRDARKGEITPCFSSVAELLAANYIFSDETVIKGIYTTSLYSYYRYFDGSFSEFSKGLLSLEENKGKSLSALMELLKTSIKVPIFAVCTGGTDSRAILANLLKENERPALIITGHKDNPDIPIAKTISEITGCPIEILDSDVKETGWLDKALQFSDGQYEPVNGYRQYQICKWSEKAAEGSIEYGGVGGEFYKNNYFSFPRFRACLNPKKELESMLSGLSKQESWMGKNILKESYSIRGKSQRYIQSNPEGKLLCRFNAVGFDILTKKACCITNICAPYFTEVDPLMDRDVIASASKAPPIAHSLALWQRREINRAYPVLCDIPTDQGYSCSINFFVYGKELLKKGAYYCSKIVSKAKHFLSIPCEKTKKDYWEDDCIKARKSELFKNALNVCKRAGFIDADAAENELPLRITGNILLLGMIFENVIF